VEPGSVNAANGKPAIAVITWGSFSSANQSFLDSFRSMLPSYDVDVVDVFALMSHEGPAFYRRGRLQAWKEFTRVLFSRREPMWGAGGCFIRSSFYSDWVRHRLSECFSKRRYAFSLQTQSLFDGSVPGIPHFVYTDHAELQCLELPGFSKKDLFPASWIAREALLYLNASAVFTMSQKTRACLIEAYGCPEERVVWVKAGQNASPGGVASPSRYARKRILFVGTKWELKGGPDLVAAYERVLHTHPDAELRIVGCSPDLQLSGCEVVGPVPVDTVGHHYDQASVLCVPTTREAYGFSFLEALAHGLPVVATNVGALPELVSEGETGYLVDVGDVNGLAERLTELLGSPETLRRLGTTAQQQAAAYTWDATVRAMRPHIERTVGALK
jgi:glycosyltransferase involved in cell wall biosynthesis